MAQEVIVLGKDGRQHIFPEGFDRQRAEAIVQANEAGQTGQETQWVNPAGARLRPGEGRFQELLRTARTAGEAAVPPLQFLNPRLQDAGVLETAAGVAGSMTPLGPVGGALAAGGTRALRGYLSGEKSEDYIPAAARQGALELIPGVPRATRALGRAIAKPTVVIPPGLALAEGRRMGAKVWEPEGARSLLEQFLNLPGATIKRTGEKAADKIKALKTWYAQARIGLPPTIDPYEIRRAAYDTAIGNTPARKFQEGTYRVYQRIKNELGEYPLTPQRLWKWTKGKWIKAGSDIPTAAQVKRDAAIAARREIGKAVDVGRGLPPGTTAQKTGEISRLIPLRTISSASQVVGAKGQQIAPRVIGSAGSSARPAGEAVGGMGFHPFLVFTPITKGMMFGTGKGIYRTGQALGRTLDYPWVPGAVRALMAAQDERNKKKR